MQSGFVSDFTVIIVLGHCKINGFDPLELLSINKIIWFPLYFLGFSKARKSCFPYHCLAAKTSTNSEERCNISVASGQLSSDRMLVLALNFFYLEHVT